jgi:hypothetical protein
MTVRHNKQAAVSPARARILSSLVLFFYSFAERNAEQSVVDPVGPGCPSKALRREAPAARSSDRALHADQIGLVERITHEAKNGDIDHHAIHLNGTQALRFSGFVGGLHLAGASDVGFAR